MIATIDFETTGLKAGEDEVLQVSIIDENYNVLLNAYCRPNNKDSWEDAQAVHGITPLMVANELPFERYVPTVLDILNKADKVIAYNAAFEDSYLKAYGIEVDTEKWIDPMIMFAEIYGEWNERKGSYKWQSLTKCATYYGYEFKAHDSLEDVKATLYAYKKMCKKRNIKGNACKRLGGGYMLILPTKGKWFNMILSGDKQEEYREIKPYYTTRFKKIFEMYPNSNIPTGLDKQLIGFRNGYGSSRPQFTALCSLDVKAGKEEWGAEPGKEYYTLYIHEIRERSGC